ncbi:MAG: F0F1 ATP synthase subunit delta [Terrimesophilobacter sp.]
MGSATRVAIANAKAALAARSGAATLAAAEALFSAGHVIGDSAQLQTAFTDTSADEKAKNALVAAVFSGMKPEARDLLSGLVSSRWSKPSDVLSGIEEIGIRIAALSAESSVDLPAELFAFGSAVSSNAELELAVANKLGDPAAKTALIDALLKGKASGQTTAIIQHLVRQPRGRRIGALLRHAASIIADQHAQAVATVTVATPLSDAQVLRLEAGLAKKYGAVRVNQIVDASIIGGMRIAVGDIVIDDSIATRVNELKLQLAG